MLFVLDNYDSFTFNLVQRFGEIDPTLEVVVERNDAVSLEDVERLKPERIVVSPGPCTPAEAGLSKAIIERFGPDVPILGVCLGHQSLAEVYGGTVGRAKRLMHGKVSEVHHTGRGVFANLPNPFAATRYHSLDVPADSLPDCLEVTAWVDSEEFGREIMGLQHKQFPVHGVQFHPESFLTEAGVELLENFLKLPAAAWA
ncbi:anthranilate synthase component II [Alienimonas sp. DA493]|uniref:anthranilate synthase component II n=1 Tax=Alienimonas sp. DA493 TaxID=3373605 RepID=UPI003754317C